jgi:hypothetical protein
MRKALALVVSTGIGLAALAGVALADRGHGMFERSDTNGDGFVTKEEFAAGRNAMFAKLDANGDKVVDQAELDKAREAFHERMQKSADASGTPMPQPDGKRHGDFMKRIDANGDGKLTVEEFTAAGEQMFARLDDNGDGKLAKDEMPKRRKHHDAPAEGEAPAQ